MELREFPKVEQHLPGAVSKGAALCRCVKAGFVPCVTFFHTLTFTCICHGLGIPVQNPFVLITVHFLHGWPTLACCTCQRTMHMLTVPGVNRLRLLSCRLRAQTVRLNQPRLE